MEMVTFIARCWCGKETEVADGETWYACHNSDLQPAAEPIDVRLTFTENELRTANANRQ